MKNPSRHHKMFYWGLLLLFISSLISLTMSLTHLIAIKLPGCPLDSSCHSIIEGKYSRLPGINWPVAFLGTAHFVAISILWINRFGQLTIWGRWIVRVSVLVSSVLIAIMILIQDACFYCIAIHCANIGFWIIMEMVSKLKKLYVADLIVYAVIFMTISAGIGTPYYYRQMNLNTRLAAELTESYQSILKNNSNPEKTLYYFPENGFSGRYILGSKKASVRIVIFSDYMCSDCIKMDNHAMNLVERNQGVHLSLKHYPMSAMCNEQFKNNDAHPNACWAARAAEAAGILHGSDGFWTTHNWLVSQRGVFNDKELRVFLSENGYEYDAFIAVMMGENTLNNVKADIQEAWELGIHYLPMIFINGTQLKGWRNPEELDKIVNRFLEAGLPPKTAVVDHPPKAELKYIIDWQNQQKSNVLIDTQRPFYGNNDDRIDVIIWGDCQEPFSAEAHMEMIDLIQSDVPIRYQFRYYPLDRNCNNNIKKTLHAHGCEAAAFLETIRFEYNREKYLQSLNDIMKKHGVLNNDFQRGISNELGLDLSRIKTSESIDIAAGIIQQDINMAESFGITAIPSIYIDGRHVPRTHIGEKSILINIIKAALNRDLK